MPKKRRKVRRKVLSKRSSAKLRSYVRRGVVVIVVLLLTSLVYLYFQNLPTTHNPLTTFENNKYSRKYPVRGVDVSHHNSYIHWERMMESGVTFVFLKSTEGIKHMDRDYARNYNLAQDADLVVGTYHFYTFGIDGKKQAQHFIKKSKVKPGDMFPAIDVEHSAINKPTSDRRKIKKIIAELMVLENELYKYYRVHPIIYTNNDCYKKYIASYFPDNVLWLCDLDSEPTVGGSKWEIWQFSHHGKVDGVVNEIDLNYFRSSFSDFKRLLMPDENSRN